VFLTIDGVGSLATENGLQIARFYLHLVELKHQSKTIILFYERSFIFT